MVVVLFVTLAFVAMPTVATAPAAVISRHENAGRQEQKTHECEDDQTNETYSVASHDFSPDRRRRCVSPIFNQVNTPA
jgi:hypothetical protein